MTRIALLLAMLLIVTTIICQNHMDLIQTMTGEFNGSEFGFNMASIDFNTDGYDDLVVASSAWNPNGVYNESQLYGKLYFYWGGHGFDNVPDMTISGTHYLNYYTQSLFNAGDINGDGNDDFVIANKDSLGRSTIEIYYSRQNPQVTPDIVLAFPLTLTGNVYAFPLGDINGDNHADLGFGFSEEAQRYGRRLMILTDITAPPMLFKETNNNMGFPLISGVGDVNHDGNDDFYMHYPINGINSPTDIRLVLYYGSTSFPVMDSLVISDNTHANVYKWGCPVGDVNGDNIDDFAAYNKYLWLGSTSLTASWDMSLSSEDGTLEGFHQPPFQSGDFNNDGYDDIVSSNYFPGYYNGVVNIWLGRQQMNGTVDLYLYPPSNYENRNFGWAKAVGDFNADGFDDIAVSAPWWAQNDHTATGKVFVYAGNAQLRDTTVANDDATIPADNSSMWRIKVYPNPIRFRQAQLNIQFIGTGYKNADDLTLEIFNIKGQKIITKQLSRRILNAGSINLDLKNSKSGNYLISIKENNQIRLSQMICIK